MAMTAETKANKKHLRPVEVVRDDDAGIPKIESVWSAELLWGRMDKHGVSRGELQERLESLGVRLEGNALSMWKSKGHVPAEHFAVVAKALYPTEKSKEREFHLQLLRTIQPEGSLALFDEMVEADARLIRHRQLERIRQKTRRAAAAKAST